MKKINKIRLIRLIRNIIIGIIIIFGIRIIFLLVLTRMTIETLFKKEDDCENNITIQITTQEKEMYNASVKRYIGEKQKGSEVKQMIETIISHNWQYVNESGKFISIHNGEYDKESKSRLADGKRVESFKNDKELDEACKTANIYENGEYGGNTQENVDEATDKMREFAKKINNEKEYKIEAAEIDGIIYAIYISPKE
ncbi:MAG: hypothetical protein ACI4VN_01270 [Clostridia bacterium]